MEKVSVDPEVYAIIERERFRGEMEKMLNDEFYSLYNRIKRYSCICWYVSSSLDGDVIEELPDDIDLFVLSDHFWYDCPNKSKILDILDHISKIDEVDIDLLSVIPTIEDKLSDTVLNMYKKEGNHPIKYWFIEGEKGYRKKVTLLLFQCENLLLYHLFFSYLKIHITYLLVKNDGCREGGNFYCCNDHNSQFFKEILNSEHRPIYWITDHNYDTLQKNFEEEPPAVRASGIFNGFCRKFRIPENKFVFRYSESSYVSVSPYQREKIKHESIVEYSKDKKLLRICDDGINNRSNLNVDFDLTFLYGNFFYDYSYYFFKEKEDKTEQIKSFKIDGEINYIKYGENNERMILIPSQCRMSNYSYKLDWIEKICRHFSARTIATMPVDSNYVERYIKFLESDETFPQTIYFFHIGDYPGLYTLIGEEELRQKAIKITGIKKMTEIVNKEYRVINKEIKFPERLPNIGWRVRNIYEM